MKQIDKYVLRQLIGPFVFFFVIFAGIIWLNQALRIVDVVIKNGQSGAVFVELSLYLLPKVSETVIPIAAFAGAIYLTNRLYAESELVVIMGVGRSPAQATLPYLVFGGLCFILMTLLTQFITPASLTAFQNRQHELSKEYLSQFIVQGEFSTVISGVTIFFGETSPEGNLSDILINDRRDPNVIVTHTSTSGQIIASEQNPKLVLFNGNIQQYRPETRTLSTVQFDSLSYDLTQFAHKVQQRHLMVRELSSKNLLWPDDGSEAAALPFVSRVIEAHGRLVKSLLAIVVPLIGAIILISSGYNRSGFFFRISLGVLFMVGINSVRGFVQGWVTQDVALWPILYAPVLLSVVVAGLLIRSGMANWKPRAQRNWLTKRLGR
ncbi:MAG: LptF/LptG family permease [Rhodobacteraceae bacterium]|nr:LptF/LptG family permease [Paracoccaceae bacterium]